ncbi:hypothetical protein [Streptomyces sp. NRRL B-24720]|nr:hypothetical protein [Streptomyces sp. NRRL B-24720]
MYEEYKEPLYAAPPLLRQRMPDAGRLGHKTGGDEPREARKRIRILRSA